MSSSGISKVLGLRTDDYQLQVTSHQGPDELKGALEGCDVVAIPAGVPRKPGEK